ncbi:hypothetical protein Tco_1246891 [Tanacetum coccineum]
MRMRADISDVPISGADIVTMKGSSCGQYSERLSWREQSRLLFRQVSDWTLTRIDMPIGLGTHRRAVVIECEKALYDSFFIWFPWLAIKKRTVYVESDSGCSGRRDLAYRYQAMCGRKSQDRATAMIVYVYGIEGCRHCGGTNSLYLWPRTAGGVVMGGLEGCGISFDRRDTAMQRVDSLETMSVLVIATESGVDDERWRGLLNAKGHGSIQNAGAISVSYDWRVKFKRGNAAGGTKLAIAERYNLLKGKDHSEKI